MPLAGSRLSSSSGLSSPLSYPHHSSGSEPRSTKSSNATANAAASAAHPRLPPRNDLGASESFTRLYSNLSGSEADPVRSFSMKKRKRRKI